MDGSEEAGKRVSWVELYFDLIFVFAVGQAAHVIVVEPRWAGVGAALGLFVTLWWTWIGFVVLYNRHGEDRPSRRLFVIAGTLPCAVAAIEMHSASESHVVSFTLALAAARVVLAVAYGVSTDQGAAVARRAAIGYAVSAALFAGSAFLPAPGRYVLWAAALLQEAGFLLLGGGRRPPRSRESGRRTRLDQLRAMLQPPADPNVAIDAAHLAERFGLMMIILLGEIVVSIGVAAVDVEHKDAGYWLGLLAGLVLAGALWWIYFDAAAPIYEYVLRASGGNPAMAYGLYAGGHLGPAFALLVIAAGVNLALHSEAPRPAAWLVCVGVAAYLVGTRAVVSGSGNRFDRLLRPLLVAATVALAALQHVLPAPGVVAVVAAWTVGIAYLVSRQTPERLKRATADPLSVLYPRRSGSEG